MYNGSNNRFGGRFSRQVSGIRPMYVYIAIGIVLLIALWFISNLLSAGIQSYFALASGILLVLGNLRDLIMNPVPQRSNTALINTMIGGGLIMFFVGSAFGSLWYIPAVLLLLISAPLMLGRAEVYGAYLMTARTAMNGVKRVISGVTRTP